MREELIVELLKLVLNNQSVIISAIAHLPGFTQANRDHMQAIADQNLEAVRKLDRTQAAA